MSPRPRFLSSFRKSLPTLIPAIEPPVPGSFHHVVHHVTLHAQQLPRVSRTLHLSARLPSYVYTTPHHHTQPPASLASYTLSYFQFHSDLHLACDCPPSPPLGTGGGPHLHCFPAFLAKTVVVVVLNFILSRPSVPPPRFDFYVRIPHPLCSVLGSRMRSAVLALRTPLGKWSDQIAVKDRIETSLRHSFSLL